MNCKPDNLCMDNQKHSVLRHVLLVITMKCLQWYGCVNERREHDTFISFLEGNTYQSRHMEDPDRNVKIILKWITK